MPDIFSELSPEECMAVCGSQGLKTAFNRLRSANDRKKATEAEVARVASADAEAAKAELLKQVESQDENATHTVNRQQGRYDAVSEGWKSDVEAILDEKAPGWSKYEIKRDMAGRATALVVE